MKFPECETCEHYLAWKICNECKSGEMYEEAANQSDMNFEVDDHFHSAAPSNE